MTLVIRDDEIIDVPDELRSIQYEGGRPLGSKLGDVIYSGPGPFDFGRFDRCNGFVSRKCKSLQRVQKFCWVLQFHLTL